MTDRSDSALRYDSLVEQTGGLGESHRWLVGRVPPGSDVLDCGCAGGYVIEALTAKGCRVDGVDIDPGAAGRARPLCRRFHEGSLEDPAFLDTLEGPYDRIIFGDVLEHLVRPDRTLARMRRLLAPGGRILVSIPNVANWRLRWRLLLGRFEYEEVGLLDHTHLRFYTHHTARSMVEGAGYRVTERSLTLGPPPFKYGWRPLSLLLRFRPNLAAYQTLLEAESARA